AAPSWWSASTTGASTWRRCRPRPARPARPARPGGTEFPATRRGEVSREVRMAEQETRVIGPDEAERFRANLGSGAGHRGEPWVCASIPPAGGGRFRAVVERAELEDLVWTYRGRPLTFGPDQTVLESWMDEDYVLDRTGPPESDTNECTCSCHDGD